MIRNVGRWLVTDVSGQPIGPIFKGQKAKHNVWLNVNFEDGTVKGGNVLLARTMSTAKELLRSMESGLAMSLKGKILHVYVCMYVCMYIYIYIAFKIFYHFPERMLPMVQWNQLFHLK
jgi:hypothetical protein